jgi:hypothetical protein
MIRQAGSVRSMRAGDSVQDRRRPADVAVDDGHARVALGDQDVEVTEHDRVVADVSHFRVGDDRAGRLVRVRRRGHAAAEVDELGDPLVRRPRHGPGEELTVLPGQRRDQRREGDLLLGQGTVGG